MTQPATLSNHIALISGAGGDLGCAVAVAYAKAGATLILIDSNQKSLEKTDDAVKLAGGHAALVVLDLTDLEQVAGLGPSLLERFGRLDSVTACHGDRATPTPLGHIAIKEWERIIRNNITATWQLLQLVTPLLNCASDGRLLAVTSDNATQTPAYNASYNVAKAGVEALVRTFQAEMANVPHMNAVLIEPGELLTRSRRIAYPYQKPGDAPKPDSVVTQLTQLLTCPASDLPTRIILSAPDTP